MAPSDTRNWQKLLGPPELDEGEEIEVSSDAWDLIQRYIYIYCDYTINTWSTLVVLISF